MELLDGQTLADRLRKGALPIDEALKIAIQIADALNLAHSPCIFWRRGLTGRVGRWFSFCMGFLNSPLAGAR